MKQTALSNPIISDFSVRTQYLKYFLVFLAGLLGPLGFAPFRIPGLMILGLSILYSGILGATRKQSFLLGFIYGFAYFGFGVSWVLISIHDYGQLNYFISGSITLLFILYLSLFPALVCYFFSCLNKQKSPILSIILFAVLWCLSEVIRSHFLTGFPWLLIGLSQIDTPLKYLAPIFGVYGLSFLCALTACLLTLFINDKSIKRYAYLLAFICILLGPGALKNIQWTQIQKDPVTIGAIQANLSMRDKWDESLFWQLLTYYEKKTQELLGKQLIILPESAIPLPARYLQDYLNALDQKALKAKSALVLGILQPVDDNETNYYNSLITLGEGSGRHRKRQLVPFGEYIPAPFVALNHWLNLPEPNILPGKATKKLIHIGKHPVATLICYEIAYPNLLRKQMPESQWIISISDNGWFGRSLASYQQLQMAQMLSATTGRYQILVNNDGLSSVINATGTITEGLPPFSSGILQSEISPVIGSTPWINWGDLPILIFCSFFLVFTLFSRIPYFHKQ